MRSGGDSDLFLSQVRVLANDQKRLQRLGRRAHEGDELGISACFDHIAVAHGDGVHTMARLHDASAFHGYADRVHRCIYA